MKSKSLGRIAFRTLLVAGMSLGVVGAIGAVSSVAAANPNNWYVKGTGTPLGALVATLTDPGAHSNDFFGMVAAVSGDTAVVGAPGTNSDVGMAYIYVKGASGWPDQPAATLNPANLPGTEGFGSAVAVSGNTAVVDYVVGDVGHVYIYVRGASGWPTTPTKTLPAPSANLDHYFGRSVAVSGNTVIVGASNNVNPPQAGAAYIYVKGTSGWPAKPTVKLSNPEKTGKHAFGVYVQVSGNTAVVSAPATKYYAGVVYVYVRGASGWPEQATVTLSDPAAHSEDDFGDISVSVSGNTLAVAAIDAHRFAGAAYIYVKGASGWPTTPTTTLSNPPPASNMFFGTSMAVSGNTMLVGDLGGPNNSDDAGFVYIYRA
jgi:FG-GAP repeat